MANTPESLSVVFLMPFRDRGQPTSIYSALSGQKADGADHKARREDFCSTFLRRFQGHLGGSVIKHPTSADFTIMQPEGFSPA